MGIRGASHEKPTKEKCLLAEVDAILNSRPLAPMESPDDHDDLVITTPGHFIAGRALRSPPARAAGSGNMSYLRHWQLVRRLQQELWQSWRACHLTAMEARTKWKRPSNNAKVGDIVFVKDLTLAQGRWPLARIIAVHPGPGTVDINCRGRTYGRDIHHLVKLYLEEEPEEKQKNSTSAPRPPVCPGSEEDPDNRLPDTETVDN